MKYALSNPPSLHFLFLLHHLCEISIFAAFCSWTQDLQERLSYRSNSIMEVQGEFGGGGGGGGGGREGGREPTRTIIDTSLLCVQLCAFVVSFYVVHRVRHSQITYV